MIKNVAKYISGFMATMMLVVGFGVLPVSAQIDVPDNICPGGQCPITGDADLSGTDRNDVVDFIIGVAQAFTFIIIALAVLVLVYGGFMFVTDNGDGKRAENGKKILTNAVIGLVIAIVAFTIVNVIANVVSGDVAGDLIN